jgi:ornithine carbamoyltransferase
MKLLDVNDLSEADIRAIWALASKPSQHFSGAVAWSFEGNGIRTRTTFIQAFQELGLNHVELPNFLKTNERPHDLAGYLDPFYALYVIRESNHQRLREFAQASSRPVINAMSSAAHPCEVLADAHYIDSEIQPIERATVGLWGPTTNVFQSWYALALVFGIKVRHFCAPRFHSENGNVVFNSSPSEAVDVLITDAWPVEFNDSTWSLSREHLARLGNPKLLPTPPFSMGREVSFDPVEYKGFVGYEQKRALLSVQRAILMHAAG